jgi:hypothetical protein
MTGLHLEMSVSMAFKGGKFSFMLKAVKRVRRAA